MLSLFPDFLCVFLRALKIFTTIVLKPYLVVMSFIRSLLFSTEFIYFWLRLAFVAACRLSLVVVSGGVLLFIEVCRLLTVAASLVPEHKL